jgi:transcription antitermination factor NusG
VWRALTVRSRHEKIVSQQLRNRGLEEFLPLYRSKRSWSDRMATVDLPLFPGYVFCRFPDAQRLLAVSTPGVATVVGFGGQDAPVATEEVDSIRQMLSSGLAVEPCSYVRAGQSVQISAGPLAGLRGTVIREKGLWRVIVNVELLHRSVAAEIGREDVQAVESIPLASPAQVALTI